MTFGSPGSSPQFGGRPPQGAPQPGTGSGNSSGSGFGAPGGPGGFGGFGAPNPAQNPVQKPSSGSGFGQGSDSGTGGSFGAPGSPDGFGQSSPAPDYRRQVATPTGPTKGPWPLLIAAGVSAVIALILLIVAPLVAAPTQVLFFGLAIGGWLLAGIVSFILLGIYTLKNTQRQAETFYVEDTTQTLLYRLIMGGSFVLVIVAAVEIAFYVGKAVGV
ncbi:MULTISPECIES: hypothetical protein [unclassified Corynebacterium]|uniref:hypothetical protein n=1 Tax=unclassified Corynebacterium TaxID=2624378 RepID=UPI001E3A0F98|nr:MULTISPECIES: hypothetical protein [unclassified Corynebacterium]